MPLIGECPFFGINWDNLEEPYKSSGLGLDFEYGAQVLQESLVPGNQGYNGDVLPGHLQTAIDETRLINGQLDNYGSHSCTINTNFDDVKKSQFNSFVSYLRLRFEKIKTLCDYQIDNREGQDCKKIALRYNFDFPSNDFNFEIDISDDTLKSSEKIEEEFTLSSFSGTIFYDFYVKPSSFQISPEELNRVLGESLNYGSSSDFVSGADSVYDFKTARTNTDDTLKNIMDKTEV